ncbi:MAG: T9SS type A sorting domain-containing protein [Prolixibacteraceae bacterium]|nr:T9SS type A sorting domain-containing protein [Prolixibacteraceae bacterium]
MKKVLLTLLFCYFFTSAFSQYQLGEFNEDNIYKTHNLQDFTLQFFYNICFDNDAATDRFFENQARKNLYDSKNRKEIYETIIMQIATMANFDEEEVIIAYIEYLNTAFEDIDEPELKRYLSNYFNVYNPLDNINDFMSKTPILNTYETIEGINTVQESINTYSGATGMAKDLVHGLGQVTEIVTLVKTTFNLSRQLQEYTLAALIRKTLQNEFAHSRYLLIKEALMAEAPPDPALYSALEALDTYFENASSFETNQLFVEEIRDHADDIVNTLVPVFSLITNKVFLSKLVSIASHGATPINLVAGMITFNIIATAKVIQLILEINAQYDNAEYSIISSTVYDWIINYYNHTGRCAYKLPGYYAAYLSLIYIREVIDLKPFYRSYSWWNELVEDVEYDLRNIKELLIPEITAPCDSKPPMVKKVESDVSEITVFFSEEIDIVSTSSQIQITDEYDNPVFFQQEYDSEKNSIKLSSQNLEGNNTYTLILQDQITDIAGNPLDGDYDEQPGGNYETSLTIIGVETSFYTHTTEGYAPLSVKFYNPSQPYGVSIAGYKWEFGDGTSSTLKQPTHTYQNPGTYTVSLTVTDNNGKDHSLVKEDYINASWYEEGHDLGIQLLFLDNEWLEPGDDLHGDIVLRNYGNYTESFYKFTYSLYNQAGELIAQNFGTGSNIPVSTSNNHSLDLSLSALPNGFYRFTVVLSDFPDCARANNTISRSIYIGNENPFNTYNKEDPVQCFKYTQTPCGTSGYSIKVGSYDKKHAWVEVYKSGGSFYEKRYVAFNSMEFFNAYQFYVVFKSYITSTETFWEFGFPSSEVSFSPYNIIVEAGKAGTYDVQSNEQDPDPVIRVSTIAGANSATVATWDHDAYVYCSDYSKVKFEVTPPNNAERKEYEYWVQMTADDDFLQKLYLTVIDPKPDFSIDIPETVLHTGQGMTSSLTAFLDTLNGFDDRVRLSISDLPPGITYSITPEYSEIPQKFKVDFQVPPDFADFGVHGCTLQFSSDSRTRNENFTFEISDISKNSIAIDSVRFIDTMIPYDTLAIYYSSQFSYHSQAITTHWQYSTDGATWNDIQASQILNNDLKDPGNDSIFWIVPSGLPPVNPQLFFRMKQKNGENFLTIISNTNLRLGLENEPDYYGIYIEGDICYLMDERTANDYNYVRKVNLSTLELLGSYRVGQTRLNYWHELEKCYNRFYIYERTNSKLYYYSSSFTYLGMRILDDDIRSIQTIGNSLYGYYYNTTLDVTELRELNSSGLETGEKINLPYFNSGEYSLHDEKNYWCGEGSRIYKFESDLKTYTEYSIGASYDFGEYEDGFTYFTRGTAELLKYSFYDPYSFYTNIATFRHINTYAPVLKDTLIYLTEDQTIPDTIFINEIINDEDTPLDGLTLEFSLVTEQIDVSFNDDSTEIYIIPRANYDGPAFFGLNINDGINSVSGNVYCAIEPVNDFPVLMLPDTIVTNEGIPIEINLEDLYFDPDNSISEIDLHISSPDPNIIIVNDSSVLSISGAENYFSTEYIDLIFEADDNAGGWDYDLIRLLINPVNDPPEPFNLVMPWDNYTTKNFYIHFSWEETHDVDGEDDSIMYYLVLESDLLDTIVPTRDTTFNLSFGGNILIYNNDLNFNWYVVASDKYDMNFSNQTNRLTIIEQPFPGKNLIIDNYYLNEGESNCFGSLDFITVGSAESPVTLEYNSALNLIALRNIQILPGFHATNGSYMHASITTDGSFCSSLPEPEIIEPHIEKSISVLNSSSIENINFEMVVYPNPCQGFITVKCSSYENNSRINIYNLTGNIVVRKEIFQLESKIDISKFRNGIYFVEVISGYNKCLQKIIKN